MIFNMVGGGGGSGATLVVSSPANVSVTVSKGDKSYTKNSGSLGSATFKGLATGTWTVTISGNGQTATKTIEITADYAITIAFFSATINVTYPAGSTCAITTDITNYSDAIFAGDKSGYWSFTVPYAGTWLVACFTGDITNPEKLAYKIVNITTDGQNESVTLSYELVLFDKDKGIDRTDITGGWSKYKDGYIGYYDNNDNSGGCGCMCKNAIDMTPYTKLVIKTGNIIYDISANGGLSSHYNGNEYVNLSPKVSLSSNATIQLDISNVNSAMYIGFNTGVHGSYYAVDQILVSYVHLE